MVRVSNASEADQAAAAGIDAVELVIRNGNSPDLSAARAAREAFPRVLRVRCDNPALTPELVCAATSIKADEIAFPLSGIHAAGAHEALPPDMNKVGIVSTADRLNDMSRAKDRIGSVMLESERDTRLIDAAPIAAIDAFAKVCRESGLAFGLAGGLEAPDVSRLLLLEPDMLAFDVAVRENHAPDGVLDRHALDAIRALVPRGQTRSGQTRVAKVTDRIFVRDFEVSLAIGAYQAERSRRQRVRFSVVAETVREARPPQDMRDVFSYDVIIETIRVLAERGHVVFVETLAEEVAASLLAYGEVVAVEVKVEKLDVVNGSVGIEISRRRAAT